MATYIKVLWHHRSASAPTVLYSELDALRFETRKIEVFADGKISYADRQVAKGGAVLGEEPIPELNEIAKDSQFAPQRIHSSEFESMWKIAVLHANQ